MTATRTPDRAPVETKRLNDDLTSRWLPLAGVGYSVLTVASDLVIDKFPDESTSPAALVKYYASHHAQVHRGGELMAIATIFLGLFVAGLVVRCRHHFGAAATMAVGGAAMLAAEIASASTYALLGSVSIQQDLTPGALQAWHIDGAAFGIGMATVVLLMGVAMAGIIGRAIPAWLGWTALVLAVARFTPVGFLASLVTLLWVLVAGVVLTARTTTD